MRAITTHSDSSALVLSGGGARGAYAVGVLAGIVEVLGSGPGDAPPFRIFTGTSVGAINIAWLAAHADRGDLDIGGLAAIWRRLRIEEHLRLDPRGLRRRREGLRLGRSVLDPRPLERLVDDNLPWQRLHENVRSARTRALVLPALEISSGRTHMFSELAPGVLFRPSRDPRRRVVPCELGSDHVLGSAAIPLVFPARRIGERYFCDGGLRFNTPISPALRTGARRLTVVSLLGRDERERPEREASYPRISFLVGKLINALLLDSIEYDLQVLERLNRVLDVVATALSEEERARLDHVLTETRGAGYRRIETLVFSPSEDLGRIAAEHLRGHREQWKLGWLSGWLLDRASRAPLGGDRDLASQFLFDGGFADRLIELGRHDARARAEEIRRFY